MKKGKRKTKGTEPPALSKPKGASNGAAVVRNWKRFWLCGCTHAAFIDRQAWDEALAHKRDFAPHFTAHLGDYCDTTAFMGAHGAEANPEPVSPDIETGLMHLNMLEPQLVMDGNHDQRPYRYLNSKSEIKAYAAFHATQAMQKCIRQELKAEHHLYTGGEQGVMLGNFRLMHGTIYNVNAARDMAETYGNVIFVHTHTVAVANARHHSQAQGINAGCLLDVKAMTYAQNRRQTKAWQHAWVYGEYCDTECRPILHTRRMPEENIPHAQQA